jgi:hypothetical protein
VAWKQIADNELSKDVETNLNVGDGLYNTNGNGLFGISYQQSPYYSQRFQCFRGFAGETGEE